MPMYRGALAELRRVHRGARWVVAGVVIEGRFHGAARVFVPASTRLRQSGLVAYRQLPDFIAPEGLAVLVALDLAHGLAVDVRTAARNEILAGWPTMKIEVDLP